MKKLFSIETIDILYELGDHYCSPPLIRQLAGLSLSRLDFDPNEASCDELKQKSSESCMSNVRWRLEGSEGNGMECFAGISKDSLLLGRVANAHDDTFGWQR